MRCTTRRWTWRAILCALALLTLVGCQSRPPTSTPAEPPALLYLERLDLVEQQGEARTVLGALPETLGAVLSAARVGEALLVLHERGLQRFGLDGQGETVQRFEAPARFGTVTTADDGRGALVTLAMDGPTGMASEIMLVREGAVQPVVALPRNARALGLTADGTGVLVLPVGQDPSYGSLWIVDAASGDTREELPIEGEGHVTLSPDGRFLLTTTQRFMGEGKPAQGGLNLYDLSQRPLTARTIELPQQPSHARALLWSADGGALLVALAAGDPYAERATPLGLWRLDVAGAALSAVAGSEALALPPAALSPDGTWLLAHDPNQPGATLLSLATGDTTRVPIPAGALVVGWR